MAVVVKPLPEEICKNCKYFNQEKLECRRYAPKIFMSESGKPITVYPTTTATETCGEFTISIEMFKATINNKE